MALQFGSCVMRDWCISVAIYLVLTLIQHKNILKSKGTSLFISTADICWADLQYMTVLMNVNQGNSAVQCEAALWSPLSSGRVSIRCLQASTANQASGQDAAMLVLLRRCSCRVNEVLHAFPPYRHGEAQPKGSGLINMFGKSSETFSPSYPDNKLLWMPNRDLKRFNSEISMLIDTSYIYLYSF